MLLDNFFHSIGNFFKGTLNMASTFNNILGWIGTHWYFILAGAVASFIVWLIRVLTIKKVPWMITVLVVIICMGISCGIAGIIDNKKNKKAEEQNQNELYIEGTNYLDPTRYVKITANGGFNTSYINAKESDPNCPTSEDKTFNINLIEYKDIVVYYYDLKIGNNIYTLNSIFHKTMSGIVFTGCFNVHVADTSTFFNTILNFSNDMLLGNNFAPLIETVDKTWGQKLSHIFGIAPYAQRLPSFYSSFYEPYDRSLLNESSPFNNKYANRYGSNVTREILNIGNKGCLEQVYNKYFQQLDKIGIKCSSDPESFGNMNTFYNSIFEAVAKNKFTSILDVTNLVADVQNEVVYKSNRFMNVSYIDRTSMNAFKDDTISSAQAPYIEVSKPANIVMVANPKLVMTLTNSKNADLSSLDITKYPVQIKLTNIDTKAEYLFTFDKMELLKNGITRALPFGTYNVLLNSKVLDFGGTNTIVTTSKEKPNINFNYIYNGNAIYSNIKLKPIQTVDLSSFDITKQPVIITLTNKQTQNVISLVYDTTTKFDNGISINILIGDYSYSIASDGLSFFNKVGDFTIDYTTTDSVFYFEYDIKNGLVITNRGSSNSSVGCDCACIFTENNLGNYLTNFYSLKSIQIVIIDLNQNTQSLFEQTTSNHTNVYRFELNSKFNTTHKYAMQVLVNYLDNSVNNIHSASNISGELTMQNDSGGNQYVHIDLKAS